MTEKRSNNFNRKIESTSTKNSFGFSHRSAQKGAAEEEGVVLLSDRNLVRVAITKSSSCNSCAMSGSCPLSSPNKKDWKVWAKNDLDAKEGDKVKIAITPSRYITIAALIFLTPVIVLLISYIVLSSLGMNDDKAVISSVILAFASYFIVRIAEKSKLSTSSYKVVEIFEGRNNLK